MSSQKNTYRIFLNLQLSQLAKKQLAKIMDEYVPTTIPKIKAKEKNFMVAPPKKKMAARTKRVVKEVLIERTKVCLMLMSKASEKSAPAPFFRFSLTRSKTTMVLLTE